jgi:hypothetical protein
VRIRSVQFFFLAFSILLAAAAGSSVGQLHPLQFVDVDGNTLSTADGHLTVVVLTTKADLSKAETVGDRIPDYCLGNPIYRMITLVEFGSHSAPVQKFLGAMAQRRLDTEAAKLQKRYAARKIEKDARRDVFAVTDFDGVLSAQLGAELSSFRVFVFGRNGELLREWDDVPTTEQLGEVLKL